MLPLNVVLMVVITLGLALLLGWSQEYAKGRKALKICVWTGVILFLVCVRLFLPDSGIGPASWADVADGIMPDGYVRHSVETSISVEENWIVGETKACKSYPLIPEIANHLNDPKEPGYAAASFHCDDGPPHTVTVNLYGHLNQPEHRTAYWRCTRDPEAFTCRQTGAE
jgi:hypothetical protein